MKQIGNNDPKPGSVCHVHGIQMQSCGIRRPESDGYEELYLLLYNAV
jgi:hypothetical protein